MTSTDVFELQFDASAIKGLVARYDPADDANAMEAGKQIRSGRHTRENLSTIYYWKTKGRGMSRLNRNSDEEIKDALQLAVSARTVRAAISVLNRAVRC